MQRDKQDTSQQGKKQKIGTSQQMEKNQSINLTGFVLLKKKKKHIRYRKTISKCYEATYNKPTAKLIQNREGRPDPSKL